MLQAFGILYGLSSTCSLVLLLFRIAIEDEKEVFMTLLLCFSSWCFCIASRLDHLKTIRPSHFLLVSLLLTVPYELLWFQRLQPYDDAILRVSVYTHAAFLGILICLESCDKRHLFLFEDDRRRSREETDGFFRQRFFLYLNGLLIKAYRTTLRLDDLGVDTNLLSEDAARRHQAYWSQPRHQSGRHALLRSIIAVLWSDIYVPILPRLLSLTTMLIQPMLISTMLGHIQNPDRGSDIGDYTILGVFALNSLCSAVFNAWYNHSITRFTVRLRSVMISALYDKVLRAKGQGSDNGSATVLMNVDLEKVLEGMKWLHEIWAIPIGVSVCSYILHRNLGAAFVLPLIIVGLATVIAWDIGDPMRSRNLEWVTKTEKRVTTMSKIAASAREIRLLGLTEVLHCTMAGLRVDELLGYRSTSSLWIFVVGIGYSMFPIFIFATFVSVAVLSLQGGGRAFSADAMFTSLSVLKLMAAMMLPFLQTIITFQGAGASIDRIQAYLMDDEELQRSNNDLGRSKADDVNLAEPCDNGFELQGNFSKPALKRAFPPWLRNVSVRNNILGESAFEADWYSMVIRACGLDRDFRELSDGDATMVGTGAMSLSGGQKNRISLARAVYARKPVIIVDEILAGLDQTTENQVFSRVFGRDGLLRQMQCTIVLATHSVCWAAHSDKVVVMSNGRLIADGRYDTLVKVRGLGETYFSSNKGDTVSEGDGPILEKSQAADPEKTSRVKSEPKTKPEDDYKRKGYAGALGYYLKSIGVTHLALYVALSIATYTSTAVQFVWVKNLVNDSISFVLFRRSIGIFSGMSLFALTVIAFYLTYFFRVLCPRSGLRLHARQLSVFMKAKFTALVTKDAGEITNLFSQDTIIVDRLLPMLMLNISTGFLEQTKNCILLVVATPLISLLIPVLVVIGYAVQHFYLRTSRQLRHLDLEAKAPLCSNFMETLAGIATIRAFGWSADFQRRNKRLQDSSQAPYYLLQDTQNWLSLVLDLIVAGIISVLIDLGFSIRILVLAWTEVETAMSAITRIRLFIDKTSQEPVRHADIADPLWPRYGAVHFRNVSASYSLHPSTPPTLQHVNLEIAAGEKVGICGRTGSGKSSLVATLLGLTNLIAGEILIDSISTVTAPLSKLRRRLITLTQDSYILEKTVRENLVPWKGVHEPGMNVEGALDRCDPSDEDMICALRNCEVWDKFEAAAPDGGSGLDTSLVDVDKLLSEGEKQLFCFARAVLSPHKVVILDEATSRCTRFGQLEIQLLTCMYRGSVDAKTDALMQRILRTELADRTIIAISHSISSVMDFDRVVVMDSGRVVENDSPKILMANNESLFAKLARAQGLLWGEAGLV
ncbi:P-loop containing nucleoside triphosphate hydrolase protein [Colletotrichum asianum]